MKKLNQIVETKIFARGRLLLGGLLLFAAVLTWAIGLSLSPHVKPVVAGTEHVRSTVLTFKRNGAIGTLILSGVAAWLLFPSRRPASQLRDWLLILLLACLAGSSVYALASLPRPASPTAAGLAANEAADYNNGLNPDAIAPGAQAKSPNAIVTGSAEQSLARPTRGAARDMPEQSLAPQEPPAPDTEASGNLPDAARDATSGDDESPSNTAEQNED